MLIIYRRHNPARCKYTSRSDFRCRCPIWADGTLSSGRRIRKTLKVRDWTKAQEMIRKWEVDGTQPRSAMRTTIEEWRDKFLEDAGARNLTDSTLRLYRLLFRQMMAFAANRGLQFANDLDLTFVTDFRASWTKINPLTASKRLERLRSIYKFAVHRKIIGENHALILKSPKVKQTPTLPFSEDQMKKILKASESDKVDPRVKAFILTMRYSGLRISDVATLRVESLSGNRLKLYQAKTGEHVSVLLPKYVADELRQVQHKHQDFFFWSGKSKVTSITGFWRARIAEVFDEAGIEDGHTHRFRDTFAVSLLSAEVSLENVSRLLGHQSIRITEKHYSPWIKSRQESLDKAVEKAMNL